MSTPPCPTVLVDLDETLLDLRGATRAWAAEFDRLHDMGGQGAAWVMAVFERERIRTADLPRHFGELRERFGLAQPVEYLIAGYRRRLPEWCTVRPDVLLGLRALRERGMRVWIVTGGQGDVQTSKIRHTGLDEVVDGWSISAVARVPKPDLYTRALIEADAQAADGGWVVGDDPHEDIAGANGADLATIWIAGGRTWPRDLPAPDHRVEHVLDAIAIIRSTPPPRPPTRSWPTGCV